MLQTQTIITVTCCFFFVVNCSLGQEIKLGIMGNMQKVRSWQSLLTQGSAINIAYDALVRDGVLSDNVTFSIFPKHTRKTQDGLGNVVDLIKHEDVDVIFGAPSSYVTAAAAHLTSYWNYPHITWAGQGYELADKSVYKTLVRTIGPITDVAKALVLMFKHFGWQNLGILNLEDTVCSFSVMAIREVLPKHNITIRQNIQHPDGFTLTTTTINDYFRLLRQNARIIFLCATSKNRVKGIRNMLLRACLMGLCHGDYLFLYADDDPLDDDNFFVGDSDDEIVRQGLKYLFLFSQARYDGEKGKENLDNFELEVIDRMVDMPWNSTDARDSGRSANDNAIYLYAAVYLYGLWLNHTLAGGTSALRNGSAFQEFSKGISFESVTSPCIIGSNADKVPDFTVKQYHGDGIIYEVAVVRTHAQMIEIEEDIVWNTRDGQPAKDAPLCGFMGEKCDDIVTEDTSYGPYILAASFTIIIILGILMIGFVLRKRQISNMMLQSIWKIHFDDIELQKSKIRIGSRVTTKTPLSQISMSYVSTMSMSCRMDAPLTKTGRFKGHVVVIRNLPNAPSTLTDDDLIALKTMREMIHENVNPFVGACFETASPCAVFQYCPKGALQDLLENDEIQLDSTFKYSLTNDLVQGICYIHESKLAVHGRLKSTNCLVDNRWVLKITDYGLNRFTNNSTSVELHEEHERYKRFLWTAPELLNENGSVSKGTKPGDIYSLGIILHEIFYRQGPFAGKSKLTTKEIIQQVRNRENPPCRPRIFEEESDVLSVIIKLMQLCWADQANDRPTIQVIRSYMKKNVQDIGKNIMDIVLKRLEKYASNLEDLVEHRTRELFTEKQKTDKLLYRMLPRSCADKLKLGEPVYPEVFESSTVYFSDIEGFTVLSAKSTPMQVVDLLNDLYTCFDNVIEHYDAYKVETIGDAYLVVSGVPKRNGNRHAGEIADMSLQILEEVRNFRLKHMPDERIRVRIGIHTGPCCAGVVGLSMPRYCLFGDTINTASRMESNGISQKIHISDCTQLALQKLGGFNTSFRAIMDIKGKGKMQTYWLTGKSGNTNDAILVE